MVYYWRYVYILKRRRQWQPTPVLLPGKSHEWRSLVSWSPWGHEELDTSFSLFPFMNWRRKSQPTPVFLPGESQGWRSLVGCHLWGSQRVWHDWSDLATAVALLCKLPKFRATHSMHTKGGWDPCLWKVAPVPSEVQPDSFCVSAQELWARRTLSPSRPVS